MPQQSKIIIFIVALFFLSSIFLFFINDKHMADGKNWWAVYFQEAKNQSLNFIIENHTDKGEFSYEIKNNDRILKSEKINVRPGEKKNVEIGLDRESGKNLIIVSDGENKKEIYKNL